VPGVVLVILSVLLMFAPLSGPSGWLARAPGAAFTFIDVGQGDACVIRSSTGAAILVDAGPVDPAFDAAFARILPWLRRHRVTSLALAVLTHPHDDHAGGYAEIVHALPVGLFVDPGEIARSRRYLAALAACASRGVRYAVPGAGQCLFDDGVVRVVVVHSRTTSGRLSPVPPRDLNDASLGLRIECDGCEVMLLGDLGAADQERMLLGAPGDSATVGRLPCVLFAAPHHGSRTGSSARFLARLDPRWVIISAGRNNRFGFPHRETLEALAARGIDPRITGRDGDISLRIRPGHAELQDARERTIRECDFPGSGAAAARGP